LAETSLCRHDYGYAELCRLYEYVIRVDNL